MIYGIGQCQAQQAMCEDVLMPVTQLRKSPGSVAFVARKYRLAGLQRRRQIDGIEQGDV
jgi:hypothetical protein